MEDFGINDQYLVFKTAPFMNDNAELWKLALEQTQTYREVVIRQLIADSRGLKLILTDGEDAAREIARILGAQVKIPVIDIARTSMAPDAGLAQAAAQIQKLPAFAGKTAQLKRMDIPRSHLSYYARWWEGTSGDRVITSKDPRYFGKAFAMVAPKWAYTQKHELTRPEKAEIKDVIDQIEQTSSRVIEIDNSFIDEVATSGL
jgi:hypothetical protein